MAEMSHSLCCSCYNDVEPKRTPSRIVELIRKDSNCCKCGSTYFCGIYYRQEEGFRYCSYTEDHA